MAPRARGLVIDATGEQVVVLTPDGAFLRLERASVVGEPAIGAEVAFEAGSVAPATGLAGRRPGGRAAGAWLSLPGRRRWAAALVAAALLAALLPAAGELGRSSRVYAHVSVDLPTGVSADLAVGGGRRRGPARRRGGARRRGV
ncbi:MAG: anti-sigma factor domain-containing protein, partial [Clostridia bacterium]|nr:anti-sigma factor domain-containing protein [Clostridia bacterium]